MNYIAAIVFLLSQSMEAAPCLQTDQSASISKAAAAGSAVRFCLHPADAPQRCFRFEKGVFQKDNGQFENGSSYSRARIQIQGKTVKACRQQCGTFNVPQITRSSRADVTADGSLLLLEKSSTETSIQFQVFDPKGPAGNFEIPLEHRESSDWFIAEDTLYVRNCVGAGPGCTGHAYNVRTGKELFVVGQDKENESPANLFDGVELPFQGSVWAFLTAGGAEVVFQDMKSGRIVRRIRAKPDDAANPENGSRMFFMAGRLLVVHTDGHVLEFDPKDGSQKNSLACSVK